MKRVYVRWEVTEEHRGDVEVPDDWSPETGEAELMEAIANQDAHSYFSTVDRVVLGVSDAS